MTDYTFDDFKEFSNSNATITRLISIGNVIREVSQTVGKAELALACIGVIVNIFHLVVLSRKSMRWNCINVIMIGIGLCDLFNMSFLINKKTKETIFPDNDCTPPSSYIADLIEIWLTAIYDGLRRLTPLLGVLMAGIRYLIVKMVTNPNFDILSDPKFSIISSLIAFVVSTCWSILYWSNLFLKEIHSWQPAKNCSEFPPGYTQPQYQLTFDVDFMDDVLLKIQIFLVGDGVFKMIPTIMLPILTGLLIIELNKARRFRKKMSMTQKKDEKSRPDHTTKLVMLMTVTFMTAEGPLGIFFVVQGWVTNIPGVIKICADLNEIFLIFVALNASIHCLICLTISSPYRNAVKELFPCRKLERKKLNFTIMVSSKSSSHSTTRAKSISS